MYHRPKSASRCNILKPAAYLRIVYRTCLIIAAAMILTSCCGYHFRSRDIGIADTDYFTEVVIRNETYEPELELILKEELTSAFMTNGWLKPNMAGGDKGAVFSCKVTGFSNKAVSYTSADDISRYELVIRLSIAIYKGSPGNTVYSMKDRRYTEQYFASSDIKVTSMDKRSAVRRVFKKFSDDVKDIISQGF